MKARRSGRPLASFLAIWQQMTEIVLNQNSSFEA
jgi:hypothetical protein